MIKKIKKNLLWEQDSKYSALDRKMFGKKTFNSFDPVAVIENNYQKTIITFIIFVFVCLAGF